MEQQTDHLKLLILAILDVTWKCYSADRQFYTSEHRLSDAITARSVFYAWRCVSIGFARLCLDRSVELQFGTDSLCEAVLGTEADAIIASDIDGIIRFWNAGAERIFGYTRNDALGQSLDIIIPERLRERHWAGYRQVMASGASQYGRGDVLAVPGVRKDGSRVSLEFTITPLRDVHGRTSGMAAILRDVTARFEELRRLKQNLAQLSSAGNHC